MTHAEALASHLARRPEMPRPFLADTQSAIEWQKALQAWVYTKESLEIAARLEGIHIEIGERQQPTCAPRADYEWRDIPFRPRKNKSPRPAWSGATKEYNRQKQAERRARVRAAVLEVQAERKGRVA